MNNNQLYNPDVLLTLANLSSDEVFTSPELANQMLDLLPESIWSDKNAKFLDPVSKTGVFLREITKRLIKGLENEIPDLQDRINHILTNQVYGIAITELTSLISRRTLYCSKNANSKYSITTAFDRSYGNIFYKSIKHTFKNARCIYCGAPQAIYNRGDELESHAYLFIHKKIPKEFKDMKFDVIVGNPPYQLNVGVEMESYAVPLYHKFVQQAKKLNPRYLTMIIPSRWFSGGRGLDEFRNEMLNDRRIRVLHDFLNANECFSGVEIKGGVCYFLWDRDNPGECEIVTHSNGDIDRSIRPLLEKNLDVFIRFNKAIPILKKVLIYNEKSFSTLVSPQTPFGLYSSFKTYTLKKKSTSSIKVYGNKFVGFINNDITISKNVQWIDKWKVYVPKAIGSGDMSVDKINPILGEPNSVCTQTYIMYGPFSSKKEAENVISYTQTKFFHFLMGLIKVTQDAMAKVYSFIPVQDFSKPWTDDELYKKYQFNSDEIKYIESMIRKEIGENND